MPTEFSHFRQDPSAAIFESSFCRVKFLFAEAWHGGSQQSTSSLPCVCFSLSCVGPCCHNVYLLCWGYSTYSSRYISAWRLWSEFSFFIGCQRVVMPCDSVDRTRHENVGLLAIVVFPCSSVDLYSHVVVLTLAKFDSAFFFSSHLLVLGHPC